MMICFPNAKINLGLNVFTRRIDGFHQIESILYPIQLCDVLEFKTADTFRIIQYGITLQIPHEQNILFKSWQLLNQEYSVPPVEIHLIKTIPAGSGLGGGSADATFFLKAIDQQFSLNLSSNRLKELAATIGSDCPFFVDNKPAFISGRGESTSPVELSLRNKYLVLAVPDIQVSTAKAYSIIKPEIPEKSIKEIVLQARESWKDELVNDFEKPIFELYPELNVIKKQLYQKGAFYASMTGSGSAVYGIFEKEPLRDELTATFKGNLFLSKFGA